MTTLRRQSRRAAGLAALAAALLLVPTAFASSRGNPEEKSLPPTANPGYLLGYPTPTYQWHGCTATATRSSLFERVPGAPLNAKGNHQGAVQFTTSRAAPYVTWAVKRGWTICGVEVAAVLDNPTVDSELLAEIGYTSGKQRGSTARDGRETILVPIKRGAIGYQDFRKFEGKTFTIDRIQGCGLRQARQIGARGLRTCFKMTDGRLAPSRGAGSPPAMFDAALLRLHIACGARHPRSGAIRLASF